MSNVLQQLCSGGKHLADNCNRRVKGHGKENSRVLPTNAGGTKSTFSVCRNCATQVAIQSTVSSHVGGGSGDCRLPGEKECSSGSKTSKAKLDAESHNGTTELAGCTTYQQGRADVLHEACALASSQLLDAVSLEREAQERATEEANPIRVLRARKLPKSKGLPDISQLGSHELLVTEEVACHCTFVKGHSTKSRKLTSPEQDGEVDILGFLQAVVVLLVEHFKTQLVGIRRWQDMLEKDTRRYQLAACSMLSSKARKAAVTKQERVVHQLATEIERLQIQIVQLRSLLPELFPPPVPST